MGENSIFLIDIDKVLRDKAGKKADRIPRFLVSYLKHIVHQDEINVFLKSVADKTGVDFLEACMEFLDIVKPLYGREREKKELAKVFQALRIEVNQEMEALKEMLYAATEALKPGGRLVVITYHSLEDRMVKNIMKTGNIEGKAKQDFFGNVETPFKLINNKVIIPSEDEIQRNPRSRSAKLRIAEKK